MNRTKFQANLTQNVLSYVSAVTDITHSVVNCGWEKIAMKDAETSTAEAHLYTWCVVRFLHVATTLHSGS